MTPFAAPVLSADARSAIEHGLLGSLIEAKAWPAITDLLTLGSWTAFAPSAHQSGLLALLLARTPPNAWQEVQPLALAFLKQTDNPFSGADPFVLPRMALTLGALDLFEALRQHPASPPSAVWHAQTWPDSQGPTDDPWIVGLLKTMPLFMHKEQGNSPALRSLLHLKAIPGWPWPGPDAQGRTWLAWAHPHLQLEPGKPFVDLPLTWAQDMKTRPTTADRQTWAFRVMTDHLSLKEHQVLQAHFPGPAVVMRPEERVQALAYRLKRWDGLVAEVNEFLEPALAGDTPVSHLRLPGKGLKGEPVGFSPLGAAMVSGLKQEAGYAWPLLELDLDTWMGPLGQEALPGINERGLAWILSQTHFGGLYDQGKPAEAWRARLMADQTPEDLWESAVQVTEALRGGPKGPVRLWNGTLGKTVCERWTDLFGHILAMDYQRRLLQDVPIEKRIDWLARLSAVGALRFRQGRNDKPAVFNFLDWNHHRSLSPTAKAALMVDIATSPGMTAEDHTKLMACWTKTCKEADALDPRDPWFHDRVERLSKASSPVMLPVLAQAQAALVVDKAHALAQDPSPKAIARTRPRSSPRS
jgi:hypothetical protein